MVMKIGGPEPPDDLKPAIAIRLKPGWSYDAKSGRFVSVEGSEVAALAELPAASEIVATAPALARSEAARADPDEDRLARSFQVILAEDADVAEVRSRLERLECVEAAQAAPVATPPRPGAGGGTGRRTASEEE